MAKTKNTKNTKNTTNTAPTTVDDAVMHEIPSDFEEVSADLDVRGIWTDHSVPLYFTPLLARIFDGSFDKPSALIVGKLNRAATLENKGETVEAKAGDYVGVFVRTGMKALLVCADCPTMIVRDESKDKDTGKGNDMKGYLVTRKKGSVGKRIPVEVDARVETAGMKTMFDEPKNRAQSLAQTEEL